MSLFDFVTVGIGDAVVILGLALCAWLAVAVAVLQPHPFTLGDVAGVDTRPGTLSAQWPSGSVTVWWRSAGDVGQGVRLWPRGEK